MTQASLIYAEGRPCGWCLDGQATTTLYATPTCITCAAGNATHRVSRWLHAVNRRRKQGK